MELPRAAVAGARRRHLRRARAPHRLRGHHVHRHQLAAAQQQPGLRRPADRRVHRRQLELAGRLVTSCQQRLPAVRGHPAELAPDARRRAGVGRQHHHLQRQPVRQPRPDRPRHRQRRQRPRQRCRPGREQHHRHPVKDRSTDLGRRRSSSAACSADAHHPSDQPDDQPGHHHQQQPSSTTSASDYRRHRLGPARPTSANADRSSHNEVYNMPYTGMSIGYGWGANDAGGSKDYADRGLYNYQPRYTTADHRGQQPGHRQLRPRRHAADDRRRLHLHACRRNPSAIDQRQLLPADQRLLRPVLRRGLPVLHRPQQRLLQHRHLGLPPTTGANNNTGNLTLTNNWTTNSSTNVTNGDRGNVVTGNVVVTNGNWPSRRPGPSWRPPASRPRSSQQDVADRGRPVRPVRRRAELQHHQRHPGRSCGTATAAPTSAGPTPRAGS